MPNADLNARDTKLVQWLNEAQAKEAELEADLTAHIALTAKRPYRTRLERHLKETRDHKRRVVSRIKALGGAPDGPTPIGEVAGKTIAAVKGQVGAIRAAVSEQAETHLRNAQEELREEHVEIAIYTRIEAFATEVGDRETATLARGIRRDEERMAKFLTGQLTTLVKDVVRAEIPRDERAHPSSRRSQTRGSSSAGTRRRSPRSSPRRASTSGGRSGGTARSAAAAPTSRSTSGARPRDDSRSGTSRPDTRRSR